jgi:DNA-binding NarL/FixJ family response regulator
MVQGEAGVSGAEQERAHLASSYPDGLTEREVEVLCRLAGGKTNGEIADELYVSVRTVERHIANIYAKIGTRGRANATAYVLTRGLV